LKTGKKLTIGLKIFCFFADINRVSSQGGEFQTGDRRFFSIN
jgi:hypothetical protein